MICLRFSCFVNYPIDNLNLETFSLFSLNRKLQHIRCWLLRAAKEKKSNAVINVLEDINYLQHPSKEVHD